MHVASGGTEVRVTVPMWLSVTLAGMYTTWWWEHGERRDVRGVKGVKVVQTVSC